VTEDCGGPADEEDGERSIVGHEFAA